MRQSPVDGTSKQTPTQPKQNHRYKLTNKAPSGVVSHVSGCTKEKKKTGNMFARCVVWVHYGIAKKNLILNRFERNLWLVHLLSARTVLWIMKNSRNSRIILRAARLVRDWKFVELVAIVNLKINNHFNLSSLWCWWCQCMSLMI